MKKEMIGNITKVFNEVPLDLDLLNGDYENYKYINFVFENNEKGQFTEEELRSLCYHNVKITIQTVDDKGNNID